MCRYLLFSSVIISTFPPPPSSTWYPPQLLPCKICSSFSSCGGGPKIEPANDGCAGEPAGSPWSKFKQSFSPVGMACVCVCAHLSDCTCVYLAVHGFQAYLVCTYFLLLASCSKTSPKASVLHTMAGRMLQDSECTDAIKTSCNGANKSIPFKIQTCSSHVCTRLIRTW